MIIIKLFAIYREKAKMDKIEMDAEKDIALNDLIEAVKEKIPSIRELIKEGRGMIAVNHEIAKFDTIVKDGDEVALIPPVSGG